MTTNIITAVFKQLAAISSVSNRTTIAVPWLCHWIRAMKIHLLRTKEAIAKYACISKYTFDIWVVTDDDSHTGRRPVMSASSIGKLCVTGAYYVIKNLQILATHYI